MKRYQLRDRETGNYLIYMSDKLTDIQEELKNQEQSDKNEDQYEENFYEIYDLERDSVIC